MIRKTICTAQKFEKPTGKLGTQKFLLHNGVEAQLFQVIKLANQHQSQQGKPIEIANIKQKSSHLLGAQYILHKSIYKCRME